VIDLLRALPPWLRQIGVGLALFVAGGVFAFGYSYHPLHGAERWKIEHLTRRLDEANRENLALGDELARLRTEESSRVDADTLAQVERELEKTRSALGKAEQDLARSERARRDASSNASRWRRRFEELNEELKEAREALAAAPTPAPEASAPPPASPLPGRDATDAPRDAQSASEARRGEPAGLDLSRGSSSAPATDGPLDSAQASPGAPGRVILEPTESSSAALP